MISESASEQSNMSPSPPTPKPAKLNAKIRAHNKTNIKKEQGELDGQHPGNKHTDHLIETTQSSVKKKSKSKLIVTKHDDDADDDGGGKDNDEDDNDDPHGGARNRLINPDNNVHQQEARHNLNSKPIKNKSDKTETNKQQKVSNNVEPIISHKNKHPNISKTTTTTTSPLKKIKKEKKRYQELVIDGFTITAFRTWEDLQDEMNERISANIRRNVQNDDSEMPNTSCSSGTTSLMTATETAFHSNSTSNTTTTTTPTLATETSLIQPKQSTPSSSGTASSEASSGVLQKNLITSQPNEPDQQDQRHQLGGSNINHHPADKRNYDQQSVQRMDYKDQQQSLLHKTLKQSSDHELRQQHNHDKTHRRDEYHKTIRSQSTRDTPIAETHQHRPISSVNSGYSYGGSGDSIHEQYRLGRSNDNDLKRPIKPQYEPQRASHASQPGLSKNHPRRSPSPPPLPHLHHPPPPSSSQTAHQYFQQYHQLYQQMQNSAQHQHHQQPAPHLQNPYLALMNHPHSAHLKGPGPPPSLPPPLMPMPLPNPSSMMAPSPFNSPYTITDTIISRQTSIIPSTALPPMPGSLEHLANNSRYGRHPHLSALDHPMAPPAFGQHQSPSSYMPSPTERSFMEFARSYANASNMSSGYSNFMSHTTMPKNAMNTPNFYGHLERMTTVDHQHRTMVQGFGAGGPGPFSGFNPGGRPPTISMFPPHYYP